MHLPNASNCSIAEAKLIGYLLSEVHPEGAPKAQFLKSFGFSGAAPETLRSALIDHARQGHVTASRQTEFGTVFEINGHLPSPDGRNPWMLVVWMIETGTDYPRLITAVPSQEASA